MEQEPPTAGWFLLSTTCFVKMCCIILGTVSTGVYRHEGIRYTIFVYFVKEKSAAHKKLLIILKYKLVDFFFCDIILMLDSDSYTPEKTPSQVPFLFTNI